MVSQRKGFTKVPNDILEKICSSQFTAKQIRTILFIIRYSYGFHKNKAVISRDKYFEVCGISNKQLRKPDGPVNKLRDAGVIQRFSHDENEIKYGVNPNVADWNIPLAIQARSVRDKKESEKQLYNRLERYESELKSYAAKKK